MADIAVNPEKLNQEKFGFSVMMEVIILQTCQLYGNVPAGTVEEKILYIVKTNKKKEYISKIKQFVNGTFMADFPAKFSRPHNCQLRDYY